MPAAIASARSSAIGAVSRSPRLSPVTRSIAIHARPSSSTPRPSSRGTAGGPIAASASASRAIRARASS
jgi:hypothetical protein